VKRADGSQTACETRREQASTPTIFCQARPLTLRRSILSKKLE